MQILIAKSNTDKLPDQFLTAVGQIVWMKERSWLLSEVELPKGEKPLRYLKPLERKSDGVEKSSKESHPQFWPVLEEFWLRMKNIIFEIKPAAQKKLADLEDSSVNPQPKRLRWATPARCALGISRPSTPDDTPDFSTPGIARAMSRGRPPGARTRLAVPFRTSTGNTSRQAPPQPLPLSPSARRQANMNDSIRVTRDPTIRAPPNEIAPQGYWPASKTDEGIMNIVLDLNHVHNNSEPRVFEQLFEKHLARLDEMAAKEKQQLDEEHAKNEAARRARMVTPALARAALEAAANRGDEDAQEKLEMLRREDEEETRDTTKGQEKEVEPEPEPERDTAITNTEAHPTPPLTLTNYAHITTNPSNPNSRFPLTTFLPPSLITPQLVTALITPYHPLASPTTQPYIWPDAPYHSSSYPAFLAGIRLRAGVPDEVSDKKVVLVLGYGWSDLVRFVRGRSDWEMVVMGDLRAAVKGGVGVWRVRVGVLVV